jgi:hypothetical protein
VPRRRREKKSPRGLKRKLKLGQQVVYALQTMTSRKQSEVNLTKLVRVEAIYESLVDEVLQRGFHGNARLELVVADGTIQQICSTVERVDKER